MQCKNEKYNETINTKQPMRNKCRTNAQPMPNNTPNNIGQTRHATGAILNNNRQRNTPNNNSQIIANDMQ